MFNLQFDPMWISSLASQYLTTRKGAEDDAKMGQAGKDVLAGERTRAKLEIIYRWKAARAIRHISRNKPRDIDRCLTKAIDAKDDRNAVTALVRDSKLGTGLHGVQIPVASAILTAIFPERFTVIDYKALAWLLSGARKTFRASAFTLAICAHADVLRRKIRSLCAR